MQLHPTLRSPRIGRPAAGFTLIELVLVLTIIVVLVGSGIYVLNKQGIIGVAKDTRVKSDLQAIGTALQLYSTVTYRYPTTEQGLEALVTKPTSSPVPEQWVAQMNQVPLDPWGQTYFYRFPGERGRDGYDLFSAGPDGEPGTEDDVGNW
jgi:general secretion pathway protein G